MPRERGENGQYRTTVTDADVFDVFDTVRGPVVTSADIADALDVTRQTARRRLNALVEDGRLAKRETAGRVVYWRPGGASDGRESGREPVETPTEEPADHSPPSIEDRDESGQDGQTPEEVLRDLTLPGRGGKLDARIDAVLGLYEYLQDHAGDPVERTDLLDLVDPEAVGYASKESFWNNFVKANSSQGRDTNALAALPGVEEWGDGEYRYTEATGEV